MAGILKMEAARESGNHAIEFDRESRFGEDQVERSHDRGCGSNCVTIQAKTAGQLAQNPEDFARFFFLKPDQLVIEIDRIQRLDEKRLARRARAVDYARQFAALPGDDGHDETLVADRHILFLQDAFITIGAQKALE